MNPGIFIYGVNSEDQLNPVFLPSADSAKKIFQQPDFLISNDSVQNIAASDSIFNQSMGGFIFSDTDSMLANDDYLKLTGNAPVFKEHNLHPFVSNPVPVKKFTPDWLTILLFLTIGFFTWLKAVNNKIIQQLFMAFFNNSVANQIVRDENIVVQRASVLLSLVFYFTGAIFLYQASVHFGWSYQFISSGFTRFVIFILFIATAYSLKMVLYRAWRRA